MDDVLHDAFQDEIDALDQFRLTYAGLYPGAPLEREDPDVRRMIEALALFSARTRLAAERSVAATSRRLFMQHFAYLLSPVASMGMLRANISARLVEPLALPRGTRVELSRVIEPVAGYPEKQAFDFRTLASVELWPLRLTKLDTIRRHRRPPQLLLELVYHHDFSRPIDTLKFYVNHGDDLLSSLDVYHQLVHGVKSAQVFVDRKPTAQDQGRPCQIDFGGCAIDEAEHTVIDHPLEQPRRLIGMLEQGLYMHVHLNLAEGKFRRLYILIDLTDSWPEQLSLRHDTFQLGVVPIENIVEADGLPIECDGTRDRYRIEHPDGNSRYRLHRLIGALRFSKEGLQPLTPAIFGVDGETYELEQEIGGAFSYLRFGLPDAFEQPVKVVPRASWYQPQAQELTARSVEISLRDHHIDGVDWRLAGPLSPATSIAALATPDALLRLVALRSQRFITAAGLRVLLTALGAQHNRYARLLTEAIHGLDYHRAPSGRSATGFIYDCDLTVGRLDRDSERALDVLRPYLKEVLRNWSGDDIRSLTINGQAELSMTERRGGRP